MPIRSKLKRSKFNLKDGKKSRSELVSTTKKDESIKALQ